jgi:DNA-binding PadR family transcriptional regulator
METTKRAYVLTPAGRASARALAARRANLDNALAALQAHGTPDTEKRRTAYLANLKVARAVPRTPEGAAPAPLGTLKHGLYARLTPEGLARLGENPSELEAHRQRFAQVFAPEDDVEQRLVRRLAEVVWRRLRLHHAQACWETERLRELLAEAPQAAHLTAEETEQRAYALAHVLNDFQWFFAQAQRLEAQVERALRKLLRKRSGGAIEFQALSRRDARELRELEDGWSAEEWVERMQSLGAQA